MAVVLWNKHTLPRMRGSFRGLEKVLSQQFVGVVKYLQSQDKRVLILGPGEKSSQGLSKLSGIDAQARRWFKLEWFKCDTKTKILIYEPTQSINE